MTLTYMLPTVTPADQAPGPAQGQWTYADYAALPDDDQRYELIAGVIFMAPAPGTGHQAVSSLITTFLTIHVQLLKQGTYRSQGVFRGHARIPSRIVASLPVPVAQFFGA